MKLEHAIRELKKCIDIVQTVGQTVKLTKRSNGYFGLCPFHLEKTPSFSVRPEKGYFKCFGCGASGDVFEFLQKQTGKLFIEIVRDLAVRYKIDIDNSNFQSERIQNSDTQLLMKMHELFQKQLTGEPLKYLIEKRRYNVEDIKNMEFGFGGNIVGLFKNRITIPIRDNHGRLVAFGGRIFLEDDNRAKYVNSASSSVYNKSNILFGLHSSLSLIRKNTFCVIVEGYFDVIALTLIGLPSVASCGTSLTKSHIELLKNYTNNVILCFDNDNAGRAAHLKALLLLLSNDFKIQTVTLPSKDVDTMWQQNKQKELLRLFENPRDAIEVQIEETFRESLGGVRYRIRSLEKIIAILAAVNDPLIKRQYVRLTASFFKEDELLLIRAVSRFQSNCHNKFIIKENTKIKTIFWSDFDRLLLWIAISNPESIIEYDYDFKNINLELKYLIEELKGGKKLPEIEINRNSILFTEIKRILVSREIISTGDIDKIFTDLSEKDTRKKMLEKIKIHYKRLIGAANSGNLDEIRKMLKNQSGLLREE